MSDSEDEIISKEQLLECKENIKNQGNQYISFSIIIKGLLQNSNYKELFQYLNDYHNIYALNEGIFFNLFRAMA